MTVKFPFAKYTRYTALNWLHLNEQCFLAHFILCRVHLRTLLVFDSSLDPPLQ